MGGSLTEFLDALGSSAATPGGGAGAAVALGMGAALVAMTARLTTGRRRFQAVQADMERVIERCDAIRAIRPWTWRRPTRKPMGT